MKRPTRGLADPERASGVVSDNCPSGIRSCETATKKRMDPDVKTPPSAPAALTEAVLLLAELEGTDCLRCRLLFFFFSFFDVSESSPGLRPMRGGERIFFTTAARESLGI